MLMRSAICSWRKSYQKRVGVTGWKGGSGLLREREGSKTTSRFSASVTMWVALPFSEEGHTEEKEDC